MKPIIGLILRSLIMTVLLQFGAMSNPKTSNEKFGSLRVNSVDASQSTAICSGYVDTSTAYQPIPSMVNLSQPVVLVYIDFPDGRVPSTGLPPIDTTELNLVPNPNAVGSFGWIRIGGNLVKQLKKYTYDDYWDQMFSTGVWVGTRNPDYASHEGYVPGQGQEAYRTTVYGSVRDYWSEVSGGNLQISSFQIRSGSTDKYHTGIVNRIDSSGGKYYIHWIKMPNNKSYYEWTDDNKQLQQLAYPATKSQLEYLHSLPTSDPEYIEFNIDTYTGKIGIIGAGGFADQANFGGYAGGVGGAYFVNPEKTIINTDPGSILQPLLGNAHELGHCLGFGHYQGGSYDIMHWGLMREIYHNCPPHLNPWAKINAGWIPLNNIIRIRTDTSVSLPPISEQSVALVTVYGDAGRENNFLSHSEFFVLENRQREGFNRFSGGEVVPPNFTGGVLVWYFSAATEFPSIPGYTDGDVNNKLSLKVSGYPYIKNTPGDPNDCYPYRGTVLDGSTDPNSLSRYNDLTGISLNNFFLVNSIAQFHVSYQLGMPPYYSAFYYAGHSPQTSNWMGAVYIEGGCFESGITVSAGTEIDVLNGAARFYDITANGTSLAPIVFQTPGYPGHHIGSWVGFELAPSQASPRSSIQHSIFNGPFDPLGYGVWLQLNATNGLAPVFRNNSCTDQAVHNYFYNTYDPNGSIDISGMDSNSLPMLLFYGRFKLDAANTYVVSPGTTTSLMFDGDVGDTTVIKLMNGHSINLYGNLQIKNGKIDFQSNANVNVFASGNLILDSKPMLAGNGRIFVASGGYLTTVQNGRAVFPSGIKLQLENGSAVNWGSGAWATFSDSVIINSNQFTVPSGNAIRALPGAKFVFPYLSEFDVNGRIAVLGSSSVRIPFTTSNPYPNPGDWSGIMCSGGGPDSLLYCDIKYANTGITLSNTSGMSYMQNDTITRCPEGGYGISVSNTGTSAPALRIYKCGIKNNDGAGLRVSNANVGVSYTRFDNNCESYVNGFDILVNNGGKLYMDSSRVQANPACYGVEVSGSGSRISLSPDEVKPGYNTFNQHWGSEIYIINSATAFLGYVSSTRYCSCNQYSSIGGGGGVLKNGDVHQTNQIGICNPPCYYVYSYSPLGGWNNVYNSYSTNCRLINNTTSNTVQARYTYWGSGNNMFCGSVDTTSQLSSSISTPAKIVVVINGEGGDQGFEYYGNDPGPGLTHDQEMAAWLLTLAQDILDDSSYALDGLHQLAYYIGPNGEYQQVLGETWSEYLASVENAQVSLPVKNLAQVLFIQGMMDNHEFTDAIIQVSGILQANPDDDTWLFCQSMKEIANIGLGNLAEAEAIFDAAFVRGSLIDTNAVKAMQDYIILAATTTGDSTDGVSHKAITPSERNWRGGKGGSKNSENAPKYYTLDQNYPNPFNPLTAISYLIPAGSRVTLKIFNLLGQEVKTLVDEYQNAGYKSIKFDASDLSSGLYFYQLRAGQFTDTKKMMLIK